jgi:acetyl esterase/lipase
MGRLGGLAAVLGLLSLSGASGAAEAKSFSVESIKDVVYYDGPDQHKVKHKLDLYLPKGHKDYPVLFFVHGGAWAHGDKNTFGLYGLLGAAYARLGIGVVVTNYRLSPEVKHPEHVKDVARAFAWCARNLGKYGARADQIFACGHSAGAHLVALLAADESYLKEHGLTAKAIRGVIPVSGPMVLPDGFLPRVFGSEKGNGKKISPIAHVRKDMPPFLIFCADNDLKGCDRRPNEAFCTALKKLENQAELVEVKDSDHLSIMVSAGKAKDKVFDAIVGFIRANTGK